MDRGSGSGDRGSGIRVGISACLLGQKVRYDGGHKRNDPLLDFLGTHVVWVPVCPEVEMGLGTPRPPMRLVRVKAGIRMITIETRVDHTTTLETWAETRLDELARATLCGYVLKKDSPSCGVQGVKVFDETGKYTSAGRGLFAEALLRRWPQLPVEDEGRLADPRIRQDFLQRVLRYRRLALHSDV
jgi:uncharacterized protein YbbK (DUF523 family)